MSVQIGPARDEDCANLLALIAAHARFERSHAPLTHEGLAAILRAPSPPVKLFVARSEAGLAGYGAVTFDFSLWRAHRWAHLDCLFVDEAQRGRAIGSALLDHALRIAREAGADRLEWQTPDWNEDAARFYSRHGADSARKLRFWVEPDTD